MSDEKEDKNEFDFLPPAEPPPSFNQEKDHYHEQVDAEDFGMVEDFGLQMEYSDEDLLPENTAPSSSVLWVSAVEATKWRMRLLSLDSIKRYS